MVENEVNHHANLEQTVAALNFLPQNDERYTCSFIELPLNNSNMLPSILHAPQLELKRLPTHLKYMFLRENETLPVIIANNLTFLQNDRLIRVLMEHKTAIGWTIANIKGISLSIYMHRIH